MLPKLHSLAILSNLACPLSLESKRYSNHQLTSSKSSSAKIQEILDCLLVASFWSSERSCAVLEDVLGNSVRSTSHYWLALSVDLFQWCSCRRRQGKVSDCFWWREQLTSHTKVWWKRGTFLNSNTSMCCSTASWWASQGMPMELSLGPCHRKWINSTSHSPIRRSVICRWGRFGLRGRINIWHSLEFQGRTL